VGKGGEATPYGEERKQADRAAPGKREEKRHEKKKGGGGGSGQLRQGGKSKNLHMKGGGEKQAV